MENENPSPVSASGALLKGKPLQVVLAGEEHQFELDEGILETVLLDPSIQDKKVAIVSVAGAFRKGKSFLLDFFLRYLNAKGHPDWLGDDESPLEGFSWRGGSERETTGILLWSEPFICKLPSGEEVVVLLMDTQGAFDSESTVKDCATVFALSTMISSVQLFTEYGRLALEDNDNVSKPFQCLEFLVRDWSFPYEAQYGAAGGRKILERRLQVSDKQHSELQQIRRHIRSCFKDIGCFLMPHPGLRVATNPHFDGRLKDIESDFKEQLKVLVPLLLDESNLVVKEINGVEITCRELVEYFKATAEANNLAAVSNAKNLYQKEMETVCGGDQPYLHPDALEREHNRYMEKALEMFRVARKMGGPQFSQPFLEQLQTEIEQLYENFQKHNEGKNIFSSARTPAVLFTVLAIAYVLSGLFGIVGMESFANLMNVVLGVFLILLVAWVYARYSGEYRNVGQHIDHVADLLWDNALAQIYAKMMEQGVKHSVQQMSQQSAKPKKDYNMYSSCCY
ncbi:hypothetical protein KUTeg_014228 [Tegillarca granosa]|uniref:GB1/RHD3-type G domain-containing protein n=1 Tax=Tegillarca granosa TaxID=220873 RepID=A0ABQ9EVZ9_TEGGR|nr:hypothetical protein KUTeg_014228 [Tegillarca granosa]